MEWAGLRRVLIIITLIFNSLLFVCNSASVKVDERDCFAVGYDCVETAHRQRCHVTPVTFLCAVRTDQSQLHVIFRWGILM